jgi:hypothetical protein
MAAILAGVLFGALGVLLLGFSLLGWFATAAMNSKGIKGGGPVIMPIAGLACLWLAFALLFG